MFRLHDYTPSLEASQFILEVEDGGLWDKGIQQNKNGTHRLPKVVQHLEKLLLSVWKKN